MYIENVKGMYAKNNWRRY